jgi:hypothetical protein
MRGLTRHLSLNFYVASLSATIIVPCVAHFRVLFAAQQDLILLSFSRHCEQSEARRRTALHYKSKHHNYHISSISLPSIFEVYNYN